MNYCRGGRSATDSPNLMMKEIENSKFELYDDRSTTKESSLEGASGIGTNGTNHTSEKAGRLEEKLDATNGDGTAEEKPDELPPGTLPDAGKDIEKLNINNRQINEVKPVLPELNKNWPFEPNDGEEDFRPTSPTTYDTLLPFSYPNIANNEQLRTAENWQEVIRQEKEMTPLMKNELIAIFNKYPNVIPKDEMDCDRYERIFLP